MQTVPPPRQKSSLFSSRFLLSLASFILFFSFIAGRITLDYRSTHQSIDIQPSRTLFHQANSPIPFPIYYTSCTEKPRIPSKFVKIPGFRPDFRALSIDCAILNTTQDNGIIISEESTQTLSIDTSSSMLKLSKKASQKQIQKDFTAFLDTLHQKSFYFDFKGQYAPHQVFVVFDFEYNESIDPYLNIIKKNSLNVSTFQLKINPIESPPTLWKSLDQHSPVSLGLHKYKQYFIVSKDTPKQRGNCFPDIGCYLFVSNPQDLLINLFDRLKSQISPFERDFNTVYQSGLVLYDTINLAHGFVSSSHKVSNVVISPEIKAKYVKFEKKLIDFVNIIYMDPWSLTFQQRMEMTKSLYAEIHSIAFQEQLIESLHLPVAHLVALYLPLSLPLISAISSASNIIIQSFPSLRAIFGTDDADSRTEKKSGLALIVKRLKKIYPIFIVLYLYFYQRNLIGSLFGLEGIKSEHDL